MTTPSPFHKQQLLVSFFVGVLFAIGLAVAGMTQPQKVIAFLDLRSDFSNGATNGATSGAWDPGLLFVMVGAIAVHLVAYRLVKRRPSPLLDLQWHLPTRKNITPALAIGSAIFGLGWGLGGYCPGPGFVSLVTGRESALVFVISMAAGMGLYRWIASLQEKHRSGAGRSAS